ncbi:MAG TPA: hypothetical protein VH763_12215 [Gemmatimonadales bacterium]|jgi:hypothetical protein
MAPMRRALQIILGLSLLGVAFSGTLTYRELCGNPTGCTVVGGPGTLLGLPVCVYGLVMYFLVAGTAAAGLWAGRAAPRSTGPTSSGIPTSSPTRT